MYMRNVEDDSSPEKLLYCAQVVLRKMGKLIKMVPLTLFIKVILSSRTVRTRWKYGIRCTAYGGRCILDICSGNPVAGAYWKYAAVTW